ncbi:OmpA family protein [Algibacter luteus]|uniref:OmpA family protein n=1 Tax=Algibacter luteus TaxID=1178825 RepID=UPI0025927AF8|nr:OmpA family protein [Algibacter luteus]WJJ96295.1 OmpA family protein [Algibacter luteus]
MKIPKSAYSILLFWIAFVFTFPNIDAQTKKLKRPGSKVGIYSVDKFVSESFDIYDKVYKYDGYAEAGTPLDDEDIDVLEDALDDLEGLSDSAPDILSDVDGTSVLKQAKATLQINKAKKALNYSIKTAKELLLGQRERDTEEEPEDESNDTSTNDNPETNSTSTNNDIGDNDDTNISDNLEIYSKFDFVPGDKLLFFDDFEKDFIGDFPSKWNANGGGEVVQINNEKWFDLLSGYGNYYIPDVKSLPEEYTIEFDVLVSGLDKKTSSTARLFIYLSSTNDFSHGPTYTVASIPFCQYTPVEIRVQNYVNRGGGGINNGVKADIRKAVLNKPHIAIAVNKQRFRIWVNEKKYIDVPRMMSLEHRVNFIKFNVNNFKDGKERIFIKNLKVSEGGEDLRRKLISEGKISTNGILFDTGSANLKPQSYGIIRQISQVLMQDENINLKIIGHTDADGTEASNLQLSQARAEAVKNALIEVYKISGSRLQTDGKGESEPVEDNSTSDGKAQNRRVEFVKI